ncbi:MAG TPA: hypothetical protein DEV93_07855 [Chloroflexi bacterium]|nr:hypothetical protein [Chloroflexota bacterium]
MPATWRRNAPVSKVRQAELEHLHQSRNEKKGTSGFEAVKLTRADVEWLLESYDNGRGPILDVSSDKRRGLSLAGVVFEGDELSDLPLSRADLRGAVFTKANLRRTQLSEANLQGASFYGCDLKGADLSRATLQDAAFVFRTVLEGARLVDTDLRHVTLDEVNLKYAVLDYANLQDVQLPGALLHGASLRHARLEGANLEGASLARADLRVVSRVVV